MTSSLSFFFVCLVYWFTLNCFVLGSVIKEKQTSVVQDTQTLSPPSRGRIDFHKQILPILNSSCIGCHGEIISMGGLRLHNRQGFLKGGDSGPSVVPGNSSNSLLLQMVQGTGKIKMPLNGEALSDNQVGLLKAWIDQGAQWPENNVFTSSLIPQYSSKHWSFKKISDPLIPSIEDSSWVHNPIDNFILSRLGKKGVKPSKEADRSTLLRRLYLDLLGLPPSISALNLFLNDTRPYAYKRLVNRVLASPHFGERWGRHWLDLAHYADSDGFEKDQPRPHAWRYREWVIDAYNQDLPYDQFILEQLAGDLIPGATNNQKVATGFNRNTLTNAEGGVDAEEFRVEQIADRTDTTGLVFMGLTMGCARCHSHKYDPISHREYYQMFAFFNTGIEKNIPAVLPEDKSAHQKAMGNWTQGHEVLLARAQEYRKELLVKLSVSSSQFVENVTKWESELNYKTVEWTPLEITSYISIGGANFTKKKDGILVVSGNNPEKDRYTIVGTSPMRNITAIRVDFLNNDSLPSSGPGRAVDGNFVLSEVKITNSPLSDPTFFQEIPVEQVLASHSQKGFEIEKAVDGDSKTGWSVDGPLGPNRAHQAIFVPRQSLGHRNSKGSTITLTLEQFYGKYKNIGSFQIFLTNAPRQDLKKLFPMAVEKALSIPYAERSLKQQSIIFDYYVSQDPALQQRLASVEGHRKGRPQPLKTMAQTITSNPNPPKTHIFERGNFLRKGEEVFPNTPSILPEFQSRNQKADRLDLALWLTNQSHPLTARVEVNRLWQHLFGHGLVKTSDDFGQRGEKPSHPKLLDWLASKFMRQGWSRKELIRLIVNSATYRQDSTIKPELNEQDPNNRLLARQNRFRVESEITRDLFLSIGGLLEPLIGGPSIRPPLPKGFKDLGYKGTFWPESKDAEKYRRSLYIFFQRSVPYPMLMTFDSPDSNTSCMRRTRSNTPLQALTLLNGNLFVESARSFGSRLLKESPGEKSERIRHAFLLALAREPNPTEKNLVQELVDNHLNIFQSNPALAKTFVGSDHSGEFSAIEMAAWIAAARMILNLDELLTRE